MNWPPFPASESSLGLKVALFTGLKVYQKYNRWEGDFCRSQRENGLRTAGADPCRVQFLKLWLFQLLSGELLLKMA